MQRLTTKKTLLKILRMTTTAPVVDQCHNVVVSSLDNNLKKRTVIVKSQCIYG